MSPAQEPSLSLADWIVLSLVREGPTHGNAVAGLVGRDGELGQIWHVHKAVVYRALDRLIDLGLVRLAGEEPSRLGPVRSLVEATGAGQRAARAWLTQPVEHTRDIRSELLVKLALLDRSGSAPDDLLTAQHERLVPLAATLRDRVEAASGFDRTLLLWRYETTTATIRFLEALLPAQP